MKISLAIPTYNSSSFVVKSFINVIDNESISEIVINDDGSNDYQQLSENLQKLNNPKIKLTKNDKNLKAYKNKYETVKKCSNNWVILLDSDNIIDNEYINKISSLTLSEDTIYCPEGSLPRFLFSEFTSVEITKKNIDAIFNNMMTVLLNTGNYFFNKVSYMKTFENNSFDEYLSILDVIYYNIFWLKDDKKLQVVKGLNYLHTVRSGSYFDDNKHLAHDINTKLRNCIKTLPKIQEPVIKASPDPTRGKTRLIWEKTYEWTTNFFNTHPELEVGAEIGVAGGQHIKSLMEKTNIKKIYGVDPYLTDSWDMHGFFNVNNDYGGFDGLYKEVKDMLTNFGNRVELIRKKSSDAHVLFEDESLDFVFIDAIHDYENCFNDIKCWKNKVRKGGFVMGHDWGHSAFPGVEKAVIEHFGNVVKGVPDPVHVWYIQV